MKIFFFLKRMQRKKFRQKMPLFDERGTDHHGENFYKYVRNLLGKHNTVASSNNRAEWRIQNRLDNTGYILSLLWGLLLLVWVIFQLRLLILSNHTHPSHTSGLPSDYVFTRSMFIVFLCTITLPSIYMGVVFSHLYDKRWPTTTPRQSPDWIGYITNNPWVLFMMCLLLFSIILLFGLTTPRSQVPTDQDIALDTGKSTTKRVYNFTQKRTWGLFKNALVFTLATIPSSFIIMWVVRQLVARKILNQFLTPDRYERTTFNGSSSDNPNINHTLGIQAWGGFFTFEVYGNDNGEYTIMQSGFFKQLFLELALFLPLLIWGIVEMSRILKTIDEVCKKSPKNTRMEECRSAVQGLGMVILFLLFAILGMWLSNMVRIIYG